MKTVESEKHSQRIEDIHKLASSRGLPLEQRINAVLEATCKLFGEQIGIVSRIEASNYTVKYVYDPTSTIEVGQKFDTDQTFCSVTMQSDKALCIYDVMESELRNHPCSKLGLASYIGKVILVDGAKYGTLNFSSVLPQYHPFLQADLELLDELCEWLGNSL